MKIFVLTDISVSVNVNHTKGLATGVDIGIYTPKISPTKLLWGKNDVRTAVQQFYAPQKLLYPPKQISGYAPESHWKLFTFMTVKYIHVCIPPPSVVCQRHNVLF